MSTSLKRSVGVLAAAAVLTAGAAPAHGAESRGRTYAGVTSKGDPIVFTLSKDGKRVTRVVEMWRAECAAGGSLPIGWSLKSNFKIGRTGGFEQNRESSAPFGDQVASLEEKVKGKVNGRSLKGSYAITMTFYDQAGSLVDTCATRFTFKAKSAPGRVFGGTTSDDLPAVMELSSNGKSIKNARIGWRADCTSDVQIQIGDTLSNIELDGNRFSDSFADDETFDDGGSGHIVYDFEGRKSGARMSGTMRVRYTSSDAAGAVIGQCDTREFRWSTTSG